MCVFVCVCVSTTQETVSGDYFTISAAGVVQMFSSGAPAEFTPIGDWVREHSVFNMMTQLPFFKTYMAKRFFRKWRAAARLSAFQKVPGGMTGTAERLHTHVKRSRTMHTRTQTHTYTCSHLEGHVRC